MRRSVKVFVSVGMFALLVALAPAVQAGTQDFSLVNQTGGTIYSLYVSESANSDWEEDILHDGVLENGARLNVSFSGRSACLWDILAVDPDENQVSFSGINLCEVSVVVLRCDEEECWAEYE